MDVGNGLGGGHLRLPAQNSVRALVVVVAREVGGFPEAAPRSARFGKGSVAMLASR